MEVGELEMLRKPKWAVWSMTEGAKMGLDHRGVMLRIFVLY